jgi:hypothetical protein
MGIRHFSGRGNFPREAFSVGREVSGWELLKGNFRLENLSELFFLFDLLSLYQFNFICGDILAKLPGENFQSV